jgi:hypothetical protein
VEFLDSFSSFFDPIADLGGEIYFDYSKGNFAYRNRTEREEEDIPENKKKKVKSPKLEDLSEEE